MRRPGKYLEAVGRGNVPSRGDGGGSGQVVVAVTPHEKRGYLRYVRYRIAEVQRQVAEAIDKMLGLEVRQVNVFVGDVRFPEDE